MTTQTPALDYATPRSASAPGRGHFAVAAALALAVGFLGANAFADAAGLPVPQDPSRDPGYVFLRVVCGIVVFVVTFVVLSVLFRELRALVHTLARTSLRPGLPIAMTCLICGTACVIAALAVQLYWMRNPAVGFGPRPYMSVQTPLMAHIITLMTFLLGAGLIAVGIWSSMGQAPSIPAHANAAAPPPLP
jgi:hypothetical protein